MSSKRVFFIMIGALILSFGLLIAAVIVGDSFLRKKSGDLMALKLENKVLDEQQLSLIQANKDIQKYAELEKTANAIVPQDKDQAKTVREIVKIAQESNIPISSISFPSSTLGQPTAPAAKDTSGSTSAAKVPAAPSITQVKPVDSISGVYQMEVTVQTDANRPVSYSSLLTFLSKLENNRRTAQVSTITITPSTNNINLVTFVLGINVFIRP
jgi:hypothetical protein